MSTNNTQSQFKVELRRPAKQNGDPPWAFIVLPQEASERLPRRGRITVQGSVNGHAFQVLLEPDGQLSHWLRLDEKLLAEAGATIGETADVEIRALEQEPDPELPSDFKEALAAAPEAEAVWNDTTTIARVDWIHWIVSAKQAKTRAKRIRDACDMLASGKRRVCCFDPSGFYSKALSAPQAAEE